MRNDYNLLKRINEQGEKKGQYDDVDSRHEARPKKRRKKNPLSNKFACIFTCMKCRTEQE